MPLHLPDRQEVTSGDGRQATGDERRATEKKASRSYALVSPVACRLSVSPCQAVTNSACGTVGVTTIPSAPQ